MCATSTPVSRNMEAALRRIYAATLEPKRVSSEIPVDVAVPATQRPPQLVGIALTG